MLKPVGIKVHQEPVNKAMSLLAQYKFVPHVTLLTSPSPKNSKPTCAPIAYIDAPIKEDARSESILGIISIMIILIFVYSGFSVATGQIQGNTEIVLRITLIAALLHLILLLWNYIMSILLRFDSETCTAVVFSGSQKTLPNGIYLWEKFFGDNPIGALPLAIYHLIQLVVDTMLVPFFENKNNKD